MTKQELAQEMLLRMQSVCSTPVNSTEYPKAIVGYARRAIMLVDQIDAEVPEFFGSSETLLNG